VHCTPGGAVRVLGEDLRMLVGGHAVGMKHARRDEQQFADEVKPGSAS
jgi:hypothetical protein